MSGSEDEFQGNTEEVPITIAISERVPDVSRDFYRVRLLRATTFLLLLSVFCILAVPILSLLLIPTGLAASWWLRSGPRFDHGGDSSHCFNRTTALSWFFIALCATLMINIIDVVFLTVALRSVKVHRGHLTAVLVVNIAVSVVATYTLYMLKKLQRLVVDLE